MKKILSTVAIVLWLTTCIWAHKETLPILRQQEAIKHLKELGNYDSLLEAVKEVREESEQTNNIITPETVGQSAKLLAEDGMAGDRFGFSLAISGETAVIGAFTDDVGANTDQGSAYVLVRSGTVWMQQAKLLATDGAAGDFFGISVAISGDTIVIGAEADDVGTKINQGSAYVFVRNGITWTQQAQLLPTDGAISDLFGVSVAISGEIVLIGAYSDNIGVNADQGSAYVFVRNGTNWTQQQQLTASNGMADDIFGFRVAINGETAVVGAVGTAADQGSAYVFVRNGTNWTQQAQLLAIGGEAHDNFGTSVEISGETVIIGAPLDDIGANADQGSAYVFTRSGTNWTQQQQLTASDSVMGDNFGQSVAISGETVIVGADFDDIGALNQGSAYVFVRSGTIWTQTQQLTASDGAAGDNFAISVAISGNNMMIGSYSDDVEANTNQGSAYAFNNTISYKSRKRIRFF